MKKLSDLFRRLWTEFDDWRLGIPRPQPREPAATGDERFLIDLSDFEPFGAVREALEEVVVLGQLLFDEYGLAWEVVEVDGDVTARVVSVVRFHRRASTHRRGAHRGFQPARPTLRQ